MTFYVSSLQSTYGIHHQKLFSNAASHLFDSMSKTESNSVAVKKRKVFPINHLNPLEFLGYVFPLYV